MQIIKVQLFGLCKNLNLHDNFLFVYHTKRNKKVTAGIKFW